MRVLLLITAFVVTIGVVAEIAPDDFTDRFRKELLDAVDDYTVEIVESLHLEVSDADDNAYTIYLNNAYELYLQDTESIDAVVDQYVGAFVETITTDGTLSIDRIVPVVKDIGWYDDMRSALAELGEESEYDYVREPLAEGLEIFYAEDTPTQIRYLDKETIAEKVDTKAIKELSIENLLRILPNISVHGADGLYMVEADGTYEASLLLVDSIWHKENFDVKGDIVVSLPARDSLLVSGTESPQLNRLTSIASQLYKESAYKISPALFVYRNGKWSLFEN